MTTPEGAKGWADPAGSAQVRTGGHGLNVAPDASPEGIRAEARRREQDGNGGEPSNAPTAAQTASCFLHGDFDATLRHCPECQERRKTTPHLAEAGEIAPSGTKTYSCPDHGQTIGAHHCAVRHCRTSEVRSFDPASGFVFGDATAAQIGTQELGR